MSLIRKHFEDRDSWLIGRQELGIGGSDAAAVCGLSPWTSPVELWRIKTGQKKQKDISANAAVERGVRMEPALRELYAAMNPQIRVEHYPYDILAQSERPWLTATLDGDLTDENGRRGILEIKTGQIMKKLTMRSGPMEMCRFTTSPKHNGSYWLLDGILLICLPRFRTSVVTGQ